MDLPQLVESTILRVLPERTEENAKEIWNHLHSRGLTKVEHLKLLKEDDFIDFLNSFESRSIVAELLKAVESDNEPQQSTRQERPPPLQQKNGKDFKIDWNDLYNINSRIKQRMIDGKKLKKKEKTEMVKRLVTQVRNRVPHADRKVFKEVTKLLKKKYPICFSGELKHEKIQKNTLTKRMQTKFDNDKRCRHRTATEKEAPTIKAAYGCKKWRLLSLPEGETVENLQSIQDEMVNHFQTARPSRWDWDFIDDGMYRTYGNQRSDINQQAEQIEKLRAAKQKQKQKGQQQQQNEPERTEQLTLTEQIQEKWPFLFQPRGMMTHFCRLTEVNLEEKIQNFIQGDNKKIVDFLLATNKGKKKRIKKRVDNARETKTDVEKTEVTALLLLLLMRFDESKDGVWIMVDSTLREADIPTAITIPKTPRLVIAGENIFEPQLIYLTMDGTVVGSAVDIIEGISLLFASYFVFNLEYEVSCQVTFEFIQRFVADINPERGNKRANKQNCAKAGGKFCPYSVHSSIAKYITKYSEYFAELNSSESEDVDNPE